MAGWGGLKAFTLTHLHERVVALDLHTLEAAVRLKVALHVALAHTRHVEVDHEQGRGGLALTLAVRLLLLRSTCAGCGSNESGVWPRCL